MVSRDEVDESYVKWLEEALQDHAHTIERLEQALRDIVEYANSYNSGPLARIAREALIERDAE